ncbi:hypothetical protein GCM10027594_07280 [Hymenobacter agri]
MAQAPAWQSAQTVATATARIANNDSKVLATATDAAGNIYLAGFFANSVTFGAITLTSRAAEDIFVTKFNPATNQFVWAQRAGGRGFDAATAMVVQGNSVYVAGYFGPLNGGAPATADFGATNLNSAGGDDLFVTKLTDTGSFVWAQRAGGTHFDEANALAVSGNSVFVAGKFHSASADFGTTTLTTAGFYDVFIAKLADLGSTAAFEWAQRAGGTENDEANALAVNGTNVYVAGNFASPTAGFGSFTLTKRGTYSSDSDAFVGKLTDAGSASSFAWVQQAGGQNLDKAYALVVSGTSVYVAGLFDTTATFGTITLTSVGAYDAFVAKLTDMGSTSSFAWAQRAGGGGGNVANGLALSGGSLYVVGSFYGTNASFGTTTLTSAGVSDIFVAKLSSAGSFLWAQQAGGVSYDEASSLLVNGSNVYVAGFFGSSVAAFGTTTLINPDASGYLGFLASLTDATLTATTAAIGPLEPAQLFPNPAHHTVTLRLPVGTVPAPLILTDALGRAVRRYPAPISPETSLDLRGLPAGLYLLRGVGLAQRLVVE